VPALGVPLREAAPAEAAVVAFCDPWMQDR
jgi:hypothetical protein